MSDIILKPCPFCGIDAGVFMTGFQHDYLKEMYRIQCKNMYCKIQTPLSDDGQGLVDLWNKRVRDE